MNVDCSRCSVVVVARVPDGAQVPPDGLGLCASCGDTVNAERVAEATELVMTQLATYETLAQLQGINVGDLPENPAERHAVLKGMLGL